MYYYAVCPFDEVETVFDNNNWLPRRKHLRQKDAIKLFVNFLKANNVYVQYRENCKLSKNRKENFFFPMQIKEDEKIGDDWLRRYFRNLIDYAFSWSQTKQGHRFWSNLNVKWKYILSIYIILQ